MNIKYIRWAAKVLKVLMVVNTLISLASFAFALLGTTLSAFQGSPSITTINALVNIQYFINIVVSAFITYTAARGLELFADIAERVEVIRRTQWEQSTGAKPQFPNG